MNYPLDITIAIPVKNEAQNLPGCLQAIGDGFVKEVVLIDSGSTDNTVSLAEAFGVTILNFDWNGKFPKKRNWFLRNYPIKTEWVLFLDADEYLTEAFKGELKQALADETKVGFWLNYTIYFLGRELKGGYPLKKLALFKPSAGEYEKIDEERWSVLDMEIHEHPVLKGNIGTIKSRIDHQDFRGVAHYVHKHAEYAQWEASRFLKVLNNTNVINTWTWKQRLKYKLMKSVFIGPAYFFGSFFLLGGIRDGARGFAFALLKMAYFTQVYCNIKEIEKRTTR